jgi:hypothetical protein
VNAVCHGGLEMKRYQSLLICMLAMFSASADSSNSRPAPPHPSSAVSSATAAVSSATVTAADFSAVTVLSAGRLRGPWATQANFAGFGGDVVKDMKATSAFVQEQAAKAGAPNGWLIVLASCGMVVLQLRRKHRSLPQRRIAPYG